MPAATASAKGCMFRPRSGMTASGPASPTPMIDAALKMPPVAYQSTPMVGMLGGLRLKEPLIEKWGRLMRGSSS